MKSRFLLSVFWIFAAACGRDHNTDLEESTVIGIPNGSWGSKASRGVDGAWKSPCQPNGQDSIQYEVRVFKERSLLIIHYFRGTQCERQDYEWVAVLKSRPSLFVGKEWHLDGSANQIQDVLIAPNTDRTAKSMRDSRNCRIRGWTKNHARSIKGSECVNKNLSLGKIILIQSADPQWITLWMEGWDKGVWLWSRL